MLKIDARTFAIAAHGNQKYGNDEPYEVHLDEVVAVIDRYVDRYPFINRDIAIASGYLHDVVEDTPMTAEGIAMTFGIQIGDACYRLTDEPGINRKQRKLNTYHKIRGSFVSTFVKLADRIANCSRGGKLDMYRREHNEFKAALYVPGMFEAMWNELDNLLEK